MVWLCIHKNIIGFDVIDKDLPKKYGRRGMLAKTIYKIYFKPMVAQNNREERNSCGDNWSVVSRLSTLLVTLDPD